MARVTNLYDDIDGSPNAVERRFSIGDQDYVIDLNDKNFHDFLLLFNRYLTKARKVNGRKERKNYAPVVDKQDRSKIRAWAIAHNRYVPSRGRFPADVVRDYYADMRNERREYVLG
jgi:hypothetical protein